MRLLDTFCGGGGAGMGYSIRGYEVVGVDIQLQPRYPFTFSLGDALEFIREHGHTFDAIHASPPCQSYSKTKRLAGNHPALIEELRELLIQTGKPYVIENVPGSPLINPVKLVGTMFGLRVIRERWFETSFSVPQPPEPLPRPKQVKMGRPVQEGDYVQVVGHFSNVPYAQKAMGIDWLGQKELAQAIPPAYTQYIAQYLTNALLSVKI